MERDEILYRLFQVVAFDLKHEHYAHVNGKALLYGQLVGGVGLSKLLKRFVRREDPILFEQRANLTQHITTSVCKNLLDIFYKIPRSNAGRKTLTYAIESPEQSVKDLKGVLGGFWGGESWDNYVNTRYVELNSLDPNGFVAFEWDDFDNTKSFLQPQPFEISSNAAIDYKYKNNILQYLIVRIEHWYDSGDLMENNAAKIRKPNDGQTKGKRFICYLPNETVQLIQVSPKSFEGGLTEEGTFLRTSIKGKPVIITKLGGENYYQYIESAKPHKLGFVPAFRVGYLRDAETNGETFVNPLHSVEPYLLKTIKVNSEFDLVASLLAFPQLVKRGGKCRDENCFEGTNTQTNQICGTCHGTGLQATAFSAQDAIVFPMPKSKEEAIPLTDMMSYLYPPIDIVKWQEEYIEKLTVKCKQVMFNSDIFTKAEVADTATGKNLDMQNVYDTLYPFASQVAKTWVFGVKVVAGLIDRSDKLVCAFFFSKDLKLKSLEDLILDLSIANTLNNAALVAHFNNDIARIIFEDQEIELLRYQTQQTYAPFSGKTQPEIMALMASPFVQKKHKILHANFGNIFDALELKFATEKKNFYLLKKEEQQKAIYEEVERIAAQIEIETPEPVLTLE
jgi:hypothetical protein